MTVPQFMRQAPFCMIPLDLIFRADGNLSDLRTFAALDFKCGKRGWWYGPMSDILTITKMADSTVRNSIKRLEKWGYIQTRQMDKQHEFVLHFTILARNVAAPAISDEGVRRYSGGGSADTVANHPIEKPQRETL